MNVEEALSEAKDALYQARSLLESSVRNPTFFFTTNAQRDIEEYGKAIDVLSQHGVSAPFERQRLARLLERGR